MFNSIGAWLILNGGPLLIKILGHLGIGLVAYTAIQYAFDELKYILMSTYGQFAGPPAEIATMLGLSEAIGIVLGALAARVVAMSAMKLQQKI